MMIGLVLSFAGLWGQAVCDSSNQAVLETLKTPSAPLNQVSLSLKVCDSICPPPVVVEVQTATPFWAIFMIYGDGAYKSFETSSPSQTVSGQYDEFNLGPHNYRLEAGENTFNPIAIMTAVYSRDRANKRVAAGPVVIGPSPAQSSDWTPFEDISQDTTLKLASSWRSARPNDTLYIALSYRQPISEIQQATAGEVSLLFDKKYFEWIGTLAAGQVPTGAPVYEDADIADYKVVKWDFDAYAANEAHRTFFAMLKVKNDFEITPDTANLATGIKMRIKWDKPASSEDAGLVLSAKRSLRKVGTESYSRSSSFDQEIELPVAIGKSNDPNQIFLSPDCFLANRRHSQTARVKTIFLNRGNGPVMQLRVKTIYDAEQWEPRRSTLTGYYPKGNGVSAHSIDNNPGYFLDTFSNENKRYSLLSSGRELQEIGVSTTPPPDGEEDYVAPYIGGYVAFDMYTRPNLPRNRSLKLDAEIYMDNDTVPSMDVSVVCNTCSQRLRWHYGLKYMYYAPGADVLNSGHGLRLTLAKNLNGPDTLLEGRYLSLKNLPTWWIQWEAGISRLMMESASGQALSFQYIDVMPLQLRWIPRDGFGILSRARFIGLSAGYTFSYLYRGTVEGATFTPKSAADRIEHSVGGSIDYGNILRRPGLSFGLGYNFRWTRYNGAVQRYGHPYLYIHYNLPYRLRF